VLGVGGGGGDSGGGTTNFSISGTLLYDNQPMPGVTVTLSGDRSASITTDSSGSYSFIVQNGDYTLSPSYVGYMCNPTSKGLSVNGSNIGNINFTMYKYEQLITSQNPQYWRWSNPYPTGNNINNVISNEGFLFAVGERGTIIRSIDEGKTWSSLNSSTDVNLIGLSSNGNKYLAIGDNGVIVFSNDSGNSWESRKINISDIYKGRLIGVTYGKGLFIVASMSGEAYLSHDGELNWVKIKPFNNNTYSPSNGLIYVNGVFLLNAGNSFYVSEDGFNWDHIIPNGLNNETIYDITFANGTWVGVGRPQGTGGIYTSSDITNWTPHPTGGSNISEITGVTYGGGKFFAVGKNQFFVSTDNGINWQASMIPFSDYYNDISFSGSTVAVLGKGGSIATIDANDLSLWVNRSNIVAKNSRGIAYGNGNYVVTTWDNGIIVSNDNGSSWGYATGAIHYLYNIEYNNNTFIGLLGPSGGIKSIDGGVTWYIVNTGGYNVTDIAYGNDKWIGVSFSSSGGTILNSNDNGDNWESSNSPTPNELNAISYGNGKFVAVGKNGATITSTDGISWQIVSSGFAGHLIDVCYGNGIFISISGTGDVLTSVDGITWQLQSNSINSNVNRLRFYQGIFIANGHNGIYLSNNGVTWDRLITPVNGGYDTAYDGENMIVVSGGSIMVTTY
jgi:photosystem II stability/assembly factor-like uncharacterized protein